MTNLTTNARILVTGASSGIGEAIAKQVASEAREIILVARRADRLEDLAADLHGAHPSLIVTVEPCDLADETSIADLAERVLRGGAVDVLVNNAGLGYEELFDRGEWESMRRMVQVNVLAVLRLTRLLIPAMVCQGSGGILFVGSGAGHAYMPKSAVYAGTKHFIDGFAESLRLDLTGTGVRITQVAPGPVDTEFDHAAGIDGSMTGSPPEAMRISAQQCAKEAVDGLNNGRPLVFPGRLYRTLMTAMTLAPRPVRRALFDRSARGLR